MHIKISETSLGTIELSRASKPFMQRGFDVVSIGIPLQFDLRARIGDNTWALSDVTADLKVQGATAGDGLLGSGLLQGPFMPILERYEFCETLMIRCSPKALSQYETARNGGIVKMRCYCLGKIQRLTPGNQGGYLVSEPVRVYDYIDIEFSREDWTAALRSCGLSVSVLVEIPFPVTDSDGLDPGLQALRDAVEAFEHGGSTAWKDSIGHIRPFLENWAASEPLAAVATKEPKDGSAVDRTWKLLSLRDALFKCCHFWVHESKSACTRSDAVLALSTFASLLKTRQA